MSINNKHIYNKLIKTGYIREPRYNIWLSRGYWDPFDAACLLNGINPYIKLASEAQINQKNKKSKSKKIDFSEEANSIFSANKDGMKNFADSLIAVFEEKEAIETWQVFPDPLILINTYLQKIGNVPEQMLKLAKKSFLDLYQKRNCNEKTREYWNNNWRYNVAAPFLKLLSNKNICYESKKSDQLQSPYNKNFINQNFSIDENAILEESAKAREIRIRNRGYELYKLLKEQNSNKKITKQIIAKQIMKEENSIYDIISTKNPLKKQPALGTYLKELRKIH